MVNALTKGYGDYIQPVVRPKFSGIKPLSLIQMLFYVIKDLFAVQAFTGVFFVCLLTFFSLRLNAERNKNKKKSKK